ncbi:MAG TPA: flavin reductase family protein [Chloroflexota bacterium]|nr:flavin reductase family protein [Chloroflexota bacterium]
MDQSRVRLEDRSIPLIDRQQFRRALGSFATGVTLATTVAGGEWHGVTANAVMSVSLEPPLVLLSIQQATRMHAAIAASDRYALNVLAADQEPIARYFADSTVTHDTDAFARFAHHIGRTGVPLLDGTLAAVECRIVGRYAAGDHTLYLGEVVHLEIGDDQPPLLYFRGAFR